MRYLFSLLSVLLWYGMSLAHYHVVLPDKPLAKVNEKISFSVKFGHPFEHEFHELSPLQSITWTDPEGKTQTLDTFEKVLDKEGKLEEVKFSMVPTKRGAYLVTVTSQPIWMEDEKVFYRDVVRVWVMVDSPKGWNRPERADFDILTRPFGIRASMTFRGQYAIEPERPHLVEWEKYNATPPKELPPDEHVTYATRTDRQGTFSLTFTESGWWGITLTANRSTPETREYKGGKYPVVDRHTLWVYVEEKIVTKPVK